MKYLMVMQIWREQMQIEIAEPGRMTQTGSSLLRLIQNNNMPVLDLLVRESIQNSLDARKMNSKYVEVDYLTGKFNSDRLADELDQLTEPLKKRFGNKEYDYLAIRDSNTSGLTGGMDYKRVKNNKYGNLLKLVYEICKPQEAEGAGGSWGIGKTVYFRIGIGLVIYYSRIQKDDGTYESRLAASYVENETLPDAMIPVYKGMSKRGIAWWGKEIDNNSTQPITDENYINKFLEIFRVDPYSDNGTGTTIIIPYINSEELLLNNRVEYLNDQNQEIIPFWGHKIEDYLSIAVQRWYAPRLNNKHYAGGAYLRAKINNTGISYDRMEPIFKVVQELYNRSNYVYEEDIICEIEEKGTEEIKLRKYLEESTIGVLSYVKISRDFLKMNAPDNKPEPYMYFNNEMRDKDVNLPTVCYTRKPAMIISYENVGAWVSNIPPTNKDEYIIGIFVLNSYNNLKDSTNTNSLEEFIRKSEKADHTSWSDWSEGNFNPRFVSKIQANVSKIISREFSHEEVANKSKVNSGLGKMFGDMLLPPENFITSISNPTSKKHAVSNNLNSNHNIAKFQIDTVNIRYSENTMSIPVILRTTSKTKIKRAKFEMLIDSENKKISISEWEDKLGISAPFSIKKFIIDIDSIDSIKYGEKVEVLYDENMKIGDLNFDGIYSDDGTCYGFKINSEDVHQIKIIITIHVDIIRKDVKPAFLLEKGV